jgi:hypothetical protein
MASIEGDAPMADLPPEPERFSTADDAAAGRTPGSAPRTPRWVLILGLIAVVLILAFVVQLLLGVRHGSGMHGQTLPSLTWRSSAVIG